MKKLPKTFGQLLKMKWRDYALSIVPMILTFTALGIMLPQHPYFIFVAPFSILCFIGIMVLTHYNTWLSYYKPGVGVLAVLENLNEDE